MQPFFIVSLQFLKTDYSVVCEVLEPAISAKAKVLTYHPYHTVQHYPIRSYSYMPLW